MIRRILIVVQFTCAIALAGFGLVDLWRDVGWSGQLNERHWARVGVQGGVIDLAHARRIPESYGQHGWRVPLSIFGEVSIRTGSNRNHWRYVVVRLPLWAMVGLLFCHPGVAFFRGPFLHRRRRKRNQCISCGYDRSGNTTGICPECGVAFST